MNERLTTDAVPKLDAYAQEVVAERVRQNKKWGPQTHIDTTDLTPSYVIPEETTKILCELERSCDKLSWSSIAAEELSEAVWAKDAQSRREELIQLAAVCLAWVEDIDQRNQEN